MKLAPLELRIPSSLDDALQQLAALGSDAQVLAAHGRPVVTLTITDAVDDVLALFEAAQ